MNLIYCKLCGAVLVTANGWMPEHLAPQREDRRVPAQTEGFYKAKGYILPKGRPTLCEVTGTGDEHVGFIQALPHPGEKE